MYTISEQRNNSSAVVGAVLGTLTVVLIVTVTIVVTVLFILSWRVSLIVQCSSYDTFYVHLVSFCAIMYVAPGAYSTSMIIYHDAICTDF